MQHKRYKVKSRIWIETEAGTFLGEGRVALLKKIKKHGSIAKAASEMNMSYSKAWEQLNHMNNSANNPLVEKITGGKNGGGTKLTPYGLKVISAFERLTKSCREHMNRQLKIMKL